MKSPESLPESEHTEEQGYGDAEDLMFVEGLDYHGHLLNGSDSYTGSDEGDYTESDSEGEESYKIGGYHPVRIGEVYMNRYKIVCKLGWGHFSTVWLAHDMEGTKLTGQLCYVALKIQKSASHYTEAAYDEVDLLTKARNNRNNPLWKQARRSYASSRLCPDEKRDPEYTGVVSLCDYFETIGPNGVHVCMVFETMGPNVLTLIKKYDFKGVPMEIVKKLAADCLVGLDYLHRVCGIIHTDMKPENVLVTCPLGVPVNKTGDPLVPLTERFEATGRHFADLPSHAGKKGDPLPPIAPELVPQTSPKKTLSRNQRRRLNQKKRGRAKVCTEEKAPVDCENKESAVMQVPDGTTQKKKKKNKKSKKNNLKGKWPDPPFVKSQLKPSRSDPCLLSYYPQQGPGPMPYHHPKSVFAKAAGLAKELRSVASVSTTPSMALVNSQPTPKKAAKKEKKSPPAITEKSIREMDIYNHESVSFKIADLGNACWIERHFSEDIQTRQYRSPEVLIGSGYGTSADIWSLACMIFELVTGDYLFDPKGSDEYPRDEDHLALIIELLGPVPEDMIAQGKRSATFFNRKGELRHIKQLRYWGLAEVLMQKYRLPSREAAELANFLQAMLTIDPNKRATAQQLLEHPWIKSSGFSIPKPSPLVDLWLGSHDDDDRASEVILNSPGYSSARSEAI
jgi:serine/threonine-protein kinase SRPK3/serine/threonine-protein kinase SRPK1